MATPPFDAGRYAGGVLASLLDVTDDAVIVTDLDATIVAWNRGSERLYEYAAEEIIGRPLAVLFPEGQRGSLPASYERIRAGLRVDNFETVRRTREGRFVEVSASLSPILDDDGGLVGALSVTRDLRVQRRGEVALQAAQARWRALLDSAVDGIIVIDARGRIEAFNPAAERLFGYAERDVLGRNVNLLMPSPYHEEHDGYLARYLREGDARIIGIGREVIGRRKDGGTFPVHLSVGEMAPGGERKFTGILHDLSGRVRMEEQLREQAALARLGEMAAVIAHEVKNPLAGIRGAIQVIGGRLPADGPEAAITREIVTRIDALAGLMRDLLLFSRPPQATRAPVDVRAVVASTAELLSTDPAVKGVVVDIQGAAPTVLADAGLLRIVFVNLLVNAAHAMKDQGIVRVGVRASNTECVIDVADAGPGIPPDVREKVFTPFFTTKSRGTGLGLPTAKRLIEAHAGSISIDCPPHGGTIVTVRLPLR